MYIRKTTKVYKGKAYTNYLLVESVHTPKGPRQRVVCSLGSLSPGPKEKWLALARKVEASLLGQLSLEAAETLVEAIVEEVYATGRPWVLASDSLEERAESIYPSRVSHREHREAGPVHVGHQFWRRLGLDQILSGAGFSEKAALLGEVLTLNRLISPSSEYAVPPWSRCTALGDILGIDVDTLNDDVLYRTLDRLHPQRVQIEKELVEREATLFNATDTVYLYDLTSTYFEGQALRNPQAKRGCSRDGRLDCKQVLVGLALDRDGFPKAHEVFDGNLRDAQTVEEMLKALEKRIGKRPGSTVVVDRGMASKESLEKITAQGMHYIVVTRQGQRNQWLADFEEGQGWAEVVRVPSQSNPFQKKSSVRVKMARQGDEVYALCVSEGRHEKDQAIRERQEERLLRDLEKLQARIKGGRLKATDKIHQAIGRLKERYPRVARYYRIEYDPEQKGFSWQEDNAKEALAEQVDGSYMLRTDRQDLTADEIWRTYLLLTRVEAAFRAMKSPLMERPIFHQLPNRVQTHIFLCVLAYRILVAIEKTLHDQGIHTSWGTIRQTLKTHQVCTMVLPTTSGKTLKIRKGATPEPEHEHIYKSLDIPSEVMKPIRTWQDPDT